MQNRYWKLLILIAIVAAFGILFAACGDDGKETSTTAALGGETTTTAGGGGDTTTTAASTETTLGGKDTVVFGAARPISGALSAFEEANFGPTYKVWAEDVNADGGIYVAEYGKKLPIELKVYDDQSDMDTSMRLITKLIEEDKVDFLLPNCTTAFNFAAAGVANAYDYIMMSGEGGATTLETELAKGGLPLYFQVLNYSNHYQMPVFADIMKEQGAKTCAIVYLDDLHGIEYQAQAQIFFETAGISIMSNTAVPVDIKDMSSIVQQIQQVNPDIICSFCYPPQTILFLQTLMQLNYSPKALLLGPGGSTQWLYNMFGTALDGVMFEGAWSINSSPEAAAYAERLKEFLEDDANIDFWGALIYRGQLEMFQQAIEKAGTLDQLKIAEVMRSEHFETILGDTFFDPNQILNQASYPGQIGQWQNGIAEVIDPGERRTAEPIYPKPAWPAK